MSKILLLTEEPNEQAANLKHSELFDITKNPFSQFFGRAIFGREIDFRKYFNQNYFIWMHAKGSRCHGDINNDGKDAIKRRINSGEHSFVVAFGKYSAKIFLSNSEAKMDYISEIMQNGPILLKEIPGFHIKEFNDVNVRIALLPHISGQAQQYWMKYANIFSNCLISVQEDVMKIINDNIKNKK